MTLSAETLVTRSLELTSPPTLYSELDALLKKPTTSTDDISRVIVTDAALTARLLKIVNSPYYGFPSEITTISRAIMVIGTQELVQLALTTTVLNSFNGIPDDLVNMNKFWRNSLSRSLTAKQLAKHSKQEKIEQFFVIALLQNIGSLLTYQLIPELAKKAIILSNSTPISLHDAEKTVMGFDHTEVGEALIRAWKLPESFIEPIRYHHSPSQAQTYKIETAIVHLSDIICSLNDDIRDTDSKSVPPLDSTAWETIGLDIEIFPEIVEQVSEELDELVAALMN